MRADCRITPPIKPNLIHDGAYVDWEIIIFKAALTDAWSYFNQGNLSIRIITRVSGYRMVTWWINAFFSHSCTCARSFLRFKYSEAGTVSVVKTILNCTRLSWYMILKNDYIHMIPVKLHNKTIQDLFTHPHHSSWASASFLFSRNRNSGFQLLANKDCMGNIVGKRALWSCKFRYCTVLFQSFYSAASFHGVCGHSILLLRSQLNFISSLLQGGWRDAECLSCWLSQWLNGWIHSSRLRILRSESCGSFRSMFANRGGSFF